jgi:hypothetical protein
VGNFLSNLAPVISSGRTLLHGVSLQQHVSVTAVTIFWMSRDKNTINTLTTYLVYLKFGVVPYTSCIYVVRILRHSEDGHRQLKHVGVNNTQLNTFTIVHFVGIQVICNSLTHRMEHIKFTIIYIQKKIIGIMAATKTKASAMALFRNCSILQLASEFLFSALKFVIDKMVNFQTSSYTHDKSRWHNLSVTRHSIIQESSYALSFHEPVNI